VKRFILKLELKSPCVVGSGEGFGAVIDTDIVFDDLCIPYVPAKRIKGCLLDSALEVREMFDRAGISFSMEIEEIFGGQGSSPAAQAFFSNLYIENYERNRLWLTYFLENYGEILSKEKILKTFTQIRQGTAIGFDGAALPHSLRTVRAVNQGNVFYGDVHLQEEDEHVLNTIYFSCLNFRHMGAHRNRGFGEVRCSLLDNEKQEIPVQNKLEEICTN